jgi:hypothetical protein
MQRQNDVAIRDLTRSLGKFSLTKSEKLQIVNLAPRQLVELYVVCETPVSANTSEIDPRQIVENLEERFSDDDLNEMLQFVEQSFLIAPASTLRNPTTTSAKATHTTNVHADGTSDADGVWDAVEGDGMENYFVHETGGGGDDLEMDDTEE